MSDWHVRQFLTALRLLVKDTEKSQLTAHDRTVAIEKVRAIQAHVERRRIHENQANGETIGNQLDAIVELSTDQEMLASLCDQQRGEAMRLLRLVQDSVYVPRGDNQTTDVMASIEALCDKLGKKYHNTEKQPNIDRALQLKALLRPIRDDLSDSSEEAVGFEHAKKVAPELTKELEFARQQVETLLHRRQKSESPLIRLIARLETNRTFLVLVLGVLTLAPLLIAYCVVHYFGFVSRDGVQPIPVIEAMAHFGELFGALNVVALILAFLAVGYQIRELSQQREELALTRKEMRRAATNQREQADQQRIAAEVGALGHIYTHYERICQDASASNDLANFLRCRIAEGTKDWAVHRMYWLIEPTSNLRREEGIAAFGRELARELANLAGARNSNTIERSLNRISFLTGRLMAEQVVSVALRSKIWSLGEWLWKCRETNTQDWATQDALKTVREVQESVADEFPEPPPESNGPATAPINWPEMAAARNNYRAPSVTTT